MKIRFAVIAAVFVACLAPSTALADVGPNNPGHHYHYGWIHKNPPPPANPGPATTRGGGGATSSGQNTTSFIAAAVPTSLAPQAPAIAPLVAPALVAPRDIVTTAEPVVPSRDVWLVAILLAALVAANVAALVWLVGRAGHYTIRRTLAPVGIGL